PNHGPGMPDHPPGSPQEHAAVETLVSSEDSDVIALLLQLIELLQARLTELLSAGDTTTLA
ncbi:MAG: hypothetical protein AAGG02_12960, partial [Cyanobacteria bacterium P01_H01_bin.15]